MHEYAGCEDLACELCDAYGDGYSAGKDKLEDELRSRLKTRHAAGCGCRPCKLIRAVGLASTRGLWAANGAAPRASRPR